MEHNAWLVSVAEHSVRFARASSAISKHGGVEAVHHLLTERTCCELENAICLSVLIERVVKGISLFSGPILSELVLHLVILEVLRVPQNYQLIIENLHYRQLVVFLLAAPERPQAHCNHDVALGLRVGFFVSLGV